MSVTIDSTNPRIIAENIRKLDDLTQATAATVAEIPVDKIPKDYSTTEQNTGVKWTDGKEIYSKTYSGAFPVITAATESVTLGVIGSGFSLIDCILKCVTSTGVQFLNQVFNVAYNPTSGNFVFNNVPNTFSEGSYDLVIYYIKPAANREPDVEPELKKVTRKKTTKKEEE